MELKDASKPVLVLASDNRGKIIEFGELFAHMRVQLMSQSDFGVSSAEETGATFAENALLKAHHACKHSGMMALSDDSGLSIDALDGRPGLYSSRYAGLHDAPPKERDAANMDKVLQELAGVPQAQRTARFVCALALVVPSGDEPISTVCEGVWEGTILEAPRGERGFGYDPIFYVADKECSAGEMPPAEKHSMSHRARAWEKLLPVLARHGIQ